MANSESGLTRSVAENGTITYQNDQGQLHREDGPALETLDGMRYWCRNGKWHREDGPAIDYGDGQKSWYVDGKPMTKNEFNAYVHSLFRLSAVLSRT